MKNLKTTLLTLGLAFGLVATASAADTYTIDASHSSVSFKIRHLVTHVRGHFNDFEGTIVMDAENAENSSVTFTIDAASIDTSNDKRDGHLRSGDFFDTENHPTITFVSSEVRKIAQGKFQVSGTLTMRGTAKEVTLPVEFLGTMGNAAGFATETTLDRQDYGISWNRSLDQGGFILGDEVHVEIALETNLQEPDDKDM